MFSADQVLINSIENTPDEMSVHYDPVCNLNQNVQFIYPIVPPGQIKQHLLQIPHVEQIHNRCQTQPTYLVLHG